MQIVSLPSTIDFEALLAPISDVRPAGENLQYSGLYDEIREARRADDTLVQGSWQRELKVPDWRQVVDLASAALKTQTKDLQVAAWLSEGLVNQFGFVGMRDSLTLVRGLHENFWETFFPEIDEGDLEARANAIEFLDRQTSLALKQIPITGSGGLNYLNWEESKNYDIPENFEALEYGQREKFQALRSQAEEEKRVTGEAWRKAKNSTNRAFYEEKLGLLNECWREFETLDAVIDEKFGRQTPGMNALKKSIDDVQTLIKKIVDEKRALEPDASDQTSKTDDATVESTNGAAVNGADALIGGGANFAPDLKGVIRSRQDALKRLSEVAEFFRKTEPHSPISYLIQRAVRWGGLPLEGWLKEVIKDESILDQLRDTLGVGSSSASEDDKS